MPSGGTKKAGGTQKNASSSSSSGRSREENAQIRGSRGRSESSRIPLFQESSPRFPSLSRASLSVKPRRNVADMLWIGPGATLVEVEHCGRRSLKRRRLKCGLLVARRASLSLWLAAGGIHLSSRVGHVCLGSCPVSMFLSWFLVKKIPF